MTRATYTGAMASSHNDCFIAGDELTSRRRNAEQEAIQLFRMTFDDFPVSDDGEPSTPPPPTQQPVEDPMDQDVGEDLYWEIDHFPDLDDGEPPTPPPPTQQLPCEQSSSLRRLMNGWATKREMDLFPASVTGCEYRDAASVTGSYADAASVTGSYADAAMVSVTGSYADAASVAGSSADAASVAGSSADAASVGSYAKAAMVSHPLLKMMTATKSSSSQNQQHYHLHLASQVKQEELVTTFATERAHKVQKATPPPWRTPTPPAAPPTLANYRQQQVVPPPPTPAPLPPPPAPPPPRCQRHLGTSVPEDYGHWVDWSSNQSSMHEASIAARADMKWNQRGPPSPANGGPRLWKGIPFNTAKNCWGYTDRGQLPQEYASIHPDWWSVANLDKEARMAHDYRIPWDLRGPPTGPIAGSPWTWRQMNWRPQSMKWMKRGGAQQY